jgi:hypothetical protein
VPVSNVGISDPLIAVANITGNPVASIAAKTNDTVTGTYTLTQADVDLGMVINSPQLLLGKDNENKDCNRYIWNCNRQ